MNSLERSFLHFTEDWRNPVGLADRRRRAVRGGPLLGADALRAQEPAPQPAAQRPDRAGDLHPGAGRSPWSGASWPSSTSRPRPRARTSRPSSPRSTRSPARCPIAYAASLAEGRRAERRLPCQPRQGRHDLGVLRRHARPEQEDAREHRLLLRHGAAQADFRRWHGGLHQHDGRHGPVPDEDKRRLAAACKEMEKYPYKVLIGPARLAAINKKVGERSRSPA